MHRHPQLEISVLFAPAICSVSWGAAPPVPRQTLTGPAILLFAPQQWHACQWERDADVIMLHFERPLQRELGMPRATGPWAPRSAAHDRALWDIASGLRLMCREDNPAASGALALAARCLAARAIELLRHEPVTLPPRGILSDEEFRLVKEYMLTHLGHPIQEVDLARCVGYSKQHFNALFKGRTGITAAEFLRQLRMDRAKELFVGGARTVKTVAEAVGYYAPGNFTTKFRRQFGVSPRQLMAQIRTESAIRRRISSKRG